MYMTAMMTGRDAVQKQLVIRGRRYSSVTNALMIKTQELLKSSLDIIYRCIRKKEDPTYLVSASLETLCSIMMLAFLFP